jgi:formylmethanofuran dehydrogenase subunit E
VDAIQYLTGCTFGKGNLIHRDYGKMAFTFFDRENGQGVRCILKPEARGVEGEEMPQLIRKVADGAANEEEKKRVQTLRQKMQDKIMTAELDALFDITAARERIPRRARVLDSLTCAECGEAAMESRTRRFAGKTLCQPCFDNVEQKV